MIFLVWQWRLKTTTQPRQTIDAVMAEIWKKWEIILWIDIKVIDYLIGLGVGSGINTSLGVFSVGYIISIGNEMWEWTSGNSRKCNFKSLLDSLENLLVCLTADEWDGETLCSETTGTTNTMKVWVCIGWEIIVDSQVNLIDINTTTKHVSSNTDTLVEIFEVIETLDTNYVLVMHNCSW